MSSYFLYQNLNPINSELMNKFLKEEINEIITILRDEEDEGFISKVKIPYILRSFLQFPSQYQIVDEVIPAIEKIEVSDQKDKSTCEIDSVINQLLIVIRSNTYSSYDKDLLLKAFRVLDTDEKGFLDLHTMFYMFKNFGINFSKENLKEMEEFCVKNENDLLGVLGKDNFENL